MAHRAVLTARQRAALFDVPTDVMALLQHYTLDDEDIENIRTRRRPENQIGFALQLCAFRYPGRLLKAGEVIPEPACRFVAAQLGLKPDDLLPYAAREKTRREHLADRVLIMSAAPGRIIEDVRVKLERPRTTDMVSSAEYLKARQFCLDTIRAESRKAFAEQNK